MNSLKSHAMNCGPFRDDMRFCLRFFSLARSRITSTSVSLIDSRTSKCTIAGQIGPPIRAEFAPRSF
jgi:hypothetical protein